MRDNDLLEKLRQVRFLQDIGDEALQQIAAVAKLVEFPVGKVIFREGEPITHFYLVVSGSVSLEICAPGLGCKRIHTITDGDLLGISPVLEQTRLTATARALSPTVAIQVNARQILTLCEHDPRFGYEFMRRAALALAMRLSATRLQLMNVFGTDLPTFPQEPEA
jgi:CRP/FNR family transcriptional regulator, cyclic AMP receptor protein